MRDLKSSTKKTRIYDYLDDIAALEILLFYCNCDNIILDSIRLETVPF